MTTNIQHSFIPGQEWIYYKLYCGPATADILLTEIIDPLTEKLINSRQIDKWFFIRYNDPDLHLRVRILVKDVKNHSVVRAKFDEVFHEYYLKGMIWKILADTYLRESWRYGENTMELVESLFFYDSRLVVKMIECTRTLEHTERWKFAITTIDHLLDDFGLTLSDKSDLISNLSTRYLNMYSKPAELSLKLDAKFRIERNYVNYYINLKDNDTTLSDSLLKYLDQRSSAIKPVFEQLRKLEFSSLLSIQLNSLMGDLIHLSINRIFTSKQIKYELVLLYFLSAYYSSLLAQRKYNAVNSGLK